MDTFAALAVTLFSLFVILCITAFFLLVKHDWNKKFLGDKWGVWGIIVWLLAILSCFGMFISIYLVLSIMLNTFWGSDY